MSDNSIENILGNNNNNNFYIDNERKIAVDECSLDVDTVYSWFDYTLDNNLEKLNLLDSFYDENGYKIYGHPDKWSFDFNQGNSGEIK